MIRYLTTALALAVLTLTVILRLNDPVEIAGFRHQIFDLYQRWHTRPAQEVPIHIVDIDEESLKRLGQWPWPRSLLAQLVTSLGEAGVSTIAFDMVFSEPDRTSPRQIAEDLPLDNELRQRLVDLPDHDRMLATAISKTRVVLGFALSDSGDNETEPVVKSGFATAGTDPRPYLIVFDGNISSLPGLTKAALGNGTLNFSPDGDGVVRKVPLVMRFKDTIVPSLAAEVLRVAQGAGSYIIRSSDASGHSGYGLHTGVTDVKVGAFVVPTDANGRVWFHAARSAKRRVPAWKVLAGQSDMNRFAGSIVLVGPSATGLHDIRFTPLGAAIPGVEIRTQIIEQILTNGFLVRPDWAKGAEVVFMVVVGLALIFLIDRLGAMPSALAGSTFLIAALSISLVMFREHRLLFDPVYPAFSIIVIFILCSVLRHIRVESEQRWIRSAFSSYVSPNLVDELVNNPKILTLGGERRDLTFLFTDLAGFTTLVEQSKPGALIPLLNEYLNEMIAIGFKHGGTLDAIVGDATTFFFNAPVAQEDHAERALACAVEMDAFADRFSKEKTAQGLPVGLTRIGVHSGPVIIGNMGGDVIFNYAAHGDAINVAARLETVNKHLGTRVCVSMETASRCRQFDGRPVGTIQLKGKAEGILAFEPLTPDEIVSERVTTYLAAYDLLVIDAEAALAAFRAAAEKHPDDPLIHFHVKRLESGDAGTLIRMASK